MFFLRTSALELREPAARSSAPTREDVVRYYEIAGPDYAAWSPKFNMHFGYFDGRTSPLRREPMLDRMNEAVLERLEIDAKRPAALADMGCGLGATARFIAAHRPRADVSGFTLVPWQVESGNRLSAESGFDRRVGLALADYAHTPLRAGSMDAAYAIESTSYAAGASKRDLVAEMSRIVKPGGRVCFSDGFRKDSRPLGSVLGAVYSRACSAWAIGEMPAIEPFVRELEEHGFEDVRAEEISWRVAPSFAHVPFLSARFALGRWLRGDFAWTKERWQNLLGPLLGCLLGSCRSRFGYYLVSAWRAGNTVPCENTEPGSLSRSAPRRS